MSLDRRLWPILIVDQGLAWVTSVVTSTIIKHWWGQQETGFNNVFLEHMNHGQSASTWDSGSGKKNIEQILSQGHVSHWLSVQRGEARPKNHIFKQSELTKEYHKVLRAEKDRKGL